MLCACQLLERMENRKFLFFAIHWLTLILLLKSSFLIVELVNLNKE